MDHVSSRYRVEGIHAGFDLPDGVKRPIAPRIAQEYANQPSGRQVGDIPPCKLSPRLLNSDFEVCKEADHRRLEIHPAITRKAPQDRIYGHGGEMSVERQGPLPLVSDGGQALDLGDRTRRRGRLSRHLSALNTDP